jgi:hypothetical protein
VYAHFNFIRLQDNIVVFDIFFENVAKVLINNLEEGESLEDPGTHEKII